MLVFRFSWAHPLSQGLASSSFGLDFLAEAVGPLTTVAALPSRASNDFWLVLTCLQPSIVTSRPFV